MAIANPASAAGTSWSSFRARPWLRRSTRPAIFLCFAGFMYVVGYQPAVTGDTFIGLTRTIVESTLLAANDGYPLMAYVPAYVPDRPQAPVHLDVLSSGYVDAGLPVLSSATSVLGRALFGPSFQPDVHLIYSIVFALLLVSAAVFLFPVVPLPVGIGAVIALALGALIGPLATTAFTGTLWSEAYSATLTAGLLATAALPKRGGSGWCFLVILGGLLAFSQFLRQEGAVTVNLVVVGTLVSTWLIAGLTGWVLRDRRLWKDTALVLATRVTTALAIAGLMTLLAPVVLRGVDALAWRVAYAQTQEPLHGAGHNLFLGLGYVDNPYNISWRDQVGRIHGLLIRPDIPIEDHRYQDLLRDEWFRVVERTPWLLTDSMRAKLADLRQLLIGGQQLGYAFVAAGLVVVATLWRALHSRSLELLIAMAGFACLWAAVAAPPLLVFPDYSVGVRGALFSTLFLLPAIMFAARSRSADPWARLQRAQRSRVIGSALAGALALAVIAAVAGAALWQVKGRQQAADLAQLAADTHPRAELQQLGYQFDERFNALAPADQEQVLTRLREPGDTSAFAVSATDAAAIPAYFQPRLAILTNGQVHLFVWLGADVPRPSYKDQGNATLFVRYCLDCSELPDRFSNDIFNVRDDHTSKDITGINDAGWRGVNRAISLPLTTLNSQPGSVRVGLEEITAWDNVEFHLSTLTSIPLQPVALAEP